MRLHLCAAVLPELQPAHSCGLPVSVRAGCGQPSGPDAEPECTSAEQNSTSEPFGFQYLT